MVEERGVMVRGDSGNRLILYTVLLPELVFDKFHKSFYTFMVMIDRCIPKKGDLIEITELTKDISSDTLRGNSLFVLCPFIFESIDSIFEFFRIEASLRQSLHHRAHDLRTVIWLTLSGRLRDEK